MPPKSRKQLEQHAKKVVEDKTFGLKNKNRSTKIQQQIHHLEASVKSGSKEMQKKQQELEQKKSAKQAKAEFEAEMARLFTVAEDKRKTDKAGADEEQKLGPNGEYLWQADDFEEVAADETRLEEQLEGEREALRSRTDLTPVTEETFRAWRQRKIQEKMDAEAARIRAAKESDGRGLRGWDLWRDNTDLFVDDEDAAAIYEIQDEDERSSDEGRTEDKQQESSAEQTRHVDPSAAAE